MSDLEELMGEMSLSDYGSDFSDDDGTDPSTEQGNEGNITEIITTLLNESAPPRSLIVNLERLHTIFSTRQPSLIHESINQGVLKALTRLVDPSAIQQPQQIMVQTIALSCLNLITEFSNEMNINLPLQKELLIGLAIEFFDLNLESSPFFKELFDLFSTFAFQNPSISHCLLSHGVLSKIVTLGSKSVGLELIQSMAFLILNLLQSSPPTHFSDVSLWDAPIIAAIGSMLKVNDPMTTKSAAMALNLLTLGENQDINNHFADLIVDSGIIGRMTFILSKPEFLPLVRNPVLQTIASIVCSKREINTESVLAANGISAILGLASPTSPKPVLDSVARALCGIAANPGNIAELKMFGAYSGLLQAVSQGGLEQLNSTKLNCAKFLSRSLLSTKPLVITQHLVQLGWFDLIVEFLKDEAGESDVVESVLSCLVLGLSTLAKNDNPDSLQSKILTESNKAVLQDLGLRQNTDNVQEQIKSILAFEPFKSSE